MKRKVIILVLQFCACLLICLSVFVLRPIWRGMDVIRWILPPLAALLSAFFAVKLKVNPYLAWLPPPLALTLAGFIASMGIAPEGGLMLLCAFIGVTGAAAGDVYNKRKVGK